MTTVQRFKQPLILTEEIFKSVGTLAFSSPKKQQKKKWDVLVGN